MKWPVSLISAESCHLVILQCLVVSVVISSCPVVLACRMSGNMLMFVQFSSIAMLLLLRDSNYLYCVKDAACLWWFVSVFELRYSVTQNVDEFLRRERSVVGQ